MRTEADENQLQRRRIAKHHVGQTVRSKQKEIWLNIWPPTSLSTPAVWVLGTHLTDLASDYSRGLASQVNPVCSRVRTSVSKPDKQNQSNLHGGNRLPLRVTGRRRRRMEVKDSLLGQSCPWRQLQSEDSACVRFKILTDVEAKAAKLDSVQLASYWENLPDRGFSPQKIDTVYKRNFLVWKYMMDAHFTHFAGYNY